MRLRTTAVLAMGAVLCAFATSSHADLIPYGQDFESLDHNDPYALGNDGWLVWGNVYDPSGNIVLYSYGAFPAPNNQFPPAFSRIVTGEGGPPQGSQQLSVFSDYENGDHAAGNLIESNVYQEQTIGIVDVNQTYVFTFDAKLGNIEGSSTARAFIKIIDPVTGYLTTSVSANMTGIPVTWSTFSLSIDIDAGLVGQLLQFGFLNRASNYEGSGIFYDNVYFAIGSPVSIEDATFGRLKSLYR